MRVEPGSVFRAGGKIDGSDPYLHIGFRAVVKLRAGDQSRPVSHSLRISYDRSRELVKVDLPPPKVDSARAIKVLYPDADESFEVPVQHEVWGPSDTVRYELRLKDAGGLISSQTVDFKVYSYRLRNRHKCPLVGWFKVKHPADVEPIDWTLGYGFDLVPQQRNATVYASADGVVESVIKDQPDSTRNPAESLTEKTDLGGALGNLLVLDHGNGEFTLYAGLSQGSIKLRIGDHVRQGDVLGIVAWHGPVHSRLLFEIMDGPTPLRSNPCPVEFVNVHPVKGELWATD